MDFRLTPEQREFSATLTKVLGDSDPVGVARAWAVADVTPGRRMWERLAEQGVPALVVPEDAGGLGASAVELCVAFEVLGHQLAVGPWIETAAYLPRALAGPRLGELVPGAIATVAVAPLAPYALDGEYADRCYAVADGRLHDAVVGTAHRSVDATRSLCEFTVRDALDPPETGDLPTASDLASLACAAELLGCGERLLADTVAYAGQRTQYGRAIGSFQALKHSLADVRIALDFARPLVFGAAVEESPARVSAAKVATGEAAYLASRTALQLHGAIGYTAEFPLSLWINRVRALVGAWGTASYHRGRIADIAISGMPR